MEEPGSEAVKRQRVDSYGSSVRLPQPPTPTQHQHPHGPPPPPQHHHAPPPPEARPIHEYSTAPSLQPPLAYHQPPPPSPFANPHHGPPPPPSSGPPPGHPHLEQNQSPYDHRPSSFGAPNQDRPPPADTNPHHGVGAHPATHPSEERSTPALRPLDTTNTGYPDSQPYPQHPAQGTPPGYPPQGPPPPPNGQIYHPHPMQIPPPPPYEHGQHPPAGPPYAEVHGGPPYSAGPYGPSGPAPWRGPYAQQQPPPSMPKKGTRATQACETCRQRKAKCDEGKPTCGYCRESRVACVYKEMQPAKADRAQKEIMDSLKRNDDNYESLRGYFTKLDQKVEKVESYLGNLNKIAAFIESLKTSPAAGQLLQDAAVKAELPPHVTAPIYDQQLPETIYDQSPLQAEPAGQTISIKIEDTPTNPATVVGHTVMAQRLLQWRAIKDLLANKAPEEDYAMAYEERKGLLRLFGRGQGQDSYDGAISGSPSSPVSSTSDDPNSRSPRYPASQDFYWGDINLGLPNIVDGKFFQNEKNHLGGLTIDGKLQLEQQTMFELMESYLNNIHILHPFLDRIRLRRMVEKVCRDYNPGLETSANRSPFTANSTYPRGGKAMKRKFSAGGVGSPEENSGHPTMNGVHGPPGSHLPRRISTAIVLLVMALGKICQYTDPLPGFAPEATNVNSEISMQFSQAAMSPVTSASSPLTPGDLRGITGAKRGSVSASINSRGMRKGDRNVDVVPGLAYFAEATNILGSLQGNTLPFAQAYLLAAIYTAQLACVIESWTWINSACRVCCFLVRDTRFSKEKDKKRVDLTRFVYLACLQLESDILAELDLRPSGIQQIDPEGHIGVPSGVVEDANEIESNTSQPDDILVYYNYQLSLRKCMNDWQRHLYPAHGDSEQQIASKFRGNYSLADREYCESTLMELRGMMDRHPELSWRESDPPATYINAARLRGKYYGAKYFIHRPFLRWALHSFTKGNLTPRVMSMYYQFVENPNAFALESKTPDGYNDQEERDWYTFQFLMSCRMCVEAAKQSTIAFDGVLKEKRLMVTNIFGTAHAQFGNMLVLSAVYTSKVLNFLINEEDFKRLLDRTIDFLRSMAPISSTLKKDSELLSIIREKIQNGYQGNAEYINPSSSFGSTIA